MADASHAEDATTITPSCGNLDMGDTGQIARLLSCPITTVGAAHGYEEIPLEVSLTLYPVACCIVVPFNIDDVLEQLVNMLCCVRL